MMRQRRRDAGISMILVVALILLSLILSVAAVILFANMEEKRRLQQSLVKETERLVRVGDDIKVAQQKSNEATGILAADDGTLSAPKAAEIMKKWRQEYFSVEALDKFPLTPPLQGEPQRFKKEDIDKFNRAKDEVAFMRTLQELVEPAATRTYHYKNRKEQLQVELGIAQEATKNRKAVAPDIPKKKEEKKAELQGTIGKLNDEIAKENEQYNTRKAKHTEDRGKAEMEIAAEAEKFVADEIKVQNEIRELRRQLEELKVKEVIKHEISFVHGKILRPDIPNKTAFINIGSRERVVPGLKFLVGKKGTQGKFDFKGKVEVKKAWMTYCEVSIIEIYDPKLRPIVEGDHIVNPLFSKDRPLIVAFVGEDRPVRLRPTYSVDEAARRIKEIGSEVRKEVTLDLDYVIFTESGVQKTPDSYEPFKKAVFLEIPIAEASEIFRFLGD